MERKLGEIDRARSIYTHAAQFCDPRAESSFWQVWLEFEKGHGNEDTFREMLRIKRSIQAQYNTQVNIMSAQMVAASKAAAEDGKVNQMDIMAALERKAQAQINKAALPREAPTTAAQREDAFVAEITAPNPEEIVIREPGEDEETVEEDATEELLEEVMVPSAVFGSASKAAEQLREQDEAHSGVRTDVDEPLTTNASKPPQKRRRH